MAIDLLLREVQGLPEDTILEVVRFIQFIKQERGTLTEPVPDIRSRLADKYAGTIRISEDFDEPLEVFKEYM